MSSIQFLEIICNLHTAHCWKVFVADMMPLKLTYFFHVLLIQFLSLYPWLQKVLVN